MKHKHGINGDMTLMFESVVVQDSNSNTTKEFRDVSIELAGKDIYIGSNYRVKWKHMTSLRCKNDVNEIDNDDDEEEDGSGSRNNNTSSSSRSLQDYRDVDFERAGFELICFRDVKKKPKQNGMSFQQRLDPQDAETRDSRTFLVRFPVPPDGHRFVGTLWEFFRKILEGGYKKECNKRQKKKDREQARREEELHEQELRRKESSYSRNSRSSRTYSKRPYDFMRKNAANIASNAEVWTDDEEEAISQETPPELVPVDDEVAEDEAGDNMGDDGIDDDKSSEHEFHHDFGEGNTTRVNNDSNVDDDNSGGAFEENNCASAVEDEKTDDEDVEKTNEKGVNDEDNEDDDDDDDEEDFVTNRLSRTSQSSIRRRVKRRGPVLDDSEDEDDEKLFQNHSAGMTTPGTAVQRVVTPKVPKETVNALHNKHNARTFLEEEEGKNQEKGQERTNDADTDEEATVQSNKKINSFFQRRPKTNDATKDKDTNSNMAILTEKSMSGAGAKSVESAAKMQPQSGDRDTNDDESHDNGATKPDLTNDSEKYDEAMPTANTSKSMKTFFAPRSKTSLVRQKTKTQARVLSPKKKKRTTTATKRVLDNDLSDSDETSTVSAGSHTSDAKGKIAKDGNGADRIALSPTRSPFLRAHSPKQNRKHFEIVRASESKTHNGRRSIEQEDPIEPADSSQSQSPLKRSASRFSGGRLTSSIKRRRLKINGSRSALEALKFADAKAQHLRSPVSTSRSNEDPIRAATVTAGERSPIQPQKLGPRVEMASSDFPNKWRGLCNDGNSCYINSSLQQLFSIPKFMQALSSRKNGNELAVKLSNLHADLSETNAGESPIHRRNAASAKHVKKVMDRLTNRFHGYQQQDAHEFLGEVIDQIHEELSPPSTGKGEENECESESETKSESTRKSVDSVARVIEPTDEFFRWNVQVCLECKSCGYSRSKEEMYRYLSIDIGHANADLRDPKFVKPAVDSCLANFFAPEDREINCEKCKVGKIATQTMKILSMPKVILLHLKRFMVVERPIAGAVDETELVFKKNKVPVELTTNLSVGNLLTNNDSNQSSGTSSTLPPDNYRLKSIVHHIGNTAKSGHYTTDALRADPEDGGDKWVSFDDGVVVEKTLDRVVQTTTNQKTAYMLLYSRD